MGRTLQIICGAVLTAAIVAFGAWCLLVFEPAIPLEADQPTSQPDRYYQAGGAECGPEGLQRVPAKEQQAKATECAKARDDQRREQSDLEQQTRAANAGTVLVHITKHQTKIALLQAVLSLLGVVATGLAAWAAVVAANAARSSVEDARKDAAEQADRFGYQLKAAQDAAQAASRGARATSRLATEAAKQVRVSELASERQLRAYVMAGELKVRNFRPGMHPVFWYSLKNRGQTPAKAIMIKTCLVLTDDAERVLMRLSGPDVQFDLGADQSTFQTVKANQRLTDEAMLLFRAKEKVFVLGGYVRYKDVFGRTRRTIFRGTLDFGELDHEGTGVLQVPRKHVRST